MKKFPKNTGLPGASAFPEKPQKLAYKLILSAYEEKQKPASGRRMESLVSLLIDQENAIG